jgi:hypothetical protein
MWSKLGAEVAGWRVVRTQESFGRGSGGPAPRPALRPAARPSRAGVNACRPPACGRARGWCRRGWPARRGSARRPRAALAGSKRAALVVLIYAIACRWVPFRLAFGPGTPPHHGGCMNRARRVEGQQAFDGKVRVNQKRLCNHLGYGWNSATSVTKDCGYQDCSSRKSDGSLSHSDYCN